MEAESLNRAKAPYEKKAKITRCAKLPKGPIRMRGCPINETALRTLRPVVTNTRTFTTDQRSSDLTFATASHGPDLDPEISILGRRAMVARRRKMRRRLK